VAHRGLTPVNRLCGFLDKDFLTIDPARGRLYAAFTEFRLEQGEPAESATAIEASACDPGPPGGPGGPARGTPVAPVCEHGTPLQKVGQHMLTGQPYLMWAACCTSPGPTAGPACRSRSRHACPRAGSSRADHDQ